MKKRFVPIILIATILMSIITISPILTSAANSTYGIGYTGDFMHYAHNAKTNKDYPAYCLDRHDKNSSRNPTYDYTMTELPNTAHYQVARYVAPFGYGNNTTAQLKELFGYDLSDANADRATQFAIYMAQEVADGNYDTIDQVLNQFHNNDDYEKYLTREDTGALAKAMAEAGLDYQKNGITITVKLKETAKTNDFVTYQGTITAKNCYGGYTGKITNLPTSATIKSNSNNLTIKNGTLTSSTKTGTDTFELTIPTSSDGKYNVTVDVATKFKTYANNKIVLFADSDDEEEQNWLIMQPDDLTPITNSTNVEIVVEKPTGFLRINKMSANKSITSGNSCYSLENAVYTIYTDAACKKAVDTLTIKADGTSNTLELNAGTYYVKETTAPNGYALDTKVYTVTITSDHTKNNPAVVTSKEPPVSDPDLITVKKQIQN